MRWTFLFAVVFVLGLDPVSSGEPPLIKLADAMEDAVIRTDGAMTRELIPMNGSDSFEASTSRHAVLGNHCLVTGFDERGRPKRRSIFNPQYYAKLRFANDNWSLVELMPRESDPAKFDAKSASYRYNHPSIAYCRFGGVWLPSEFREAEIIGGPTPKNGGVQYHLRGPVRDVVGNLIDDSFERVIVVDDSGTRLLSAYPVFKEGSIASWTGYVWDDESKDSYPTTKKHGLVDPGDVTTIDDDKIQETGHSNFEFTADPGFEPEQTFLSYYGIPEPAEVRNPNWFLWVLGFGALITVVGWVLVRNQKTAQSS